MNREYKAFTPGYIKILDEAEGIVEAIISTFGVPDKGRPPDVVQPGAFRKTIAERGGKVLVLDAHKLDSTLRVIGRPLELREMGRNELPPDFSAVFPEATGALYAKVQFLLDTPEGLGVFKRIQSGALSEWSFGFDVLDKDFSEIEFRGEKMRVRNLRTIKLYEISPVPFGMGDTTSLSAKEDALPTKEMARPPFVKGFNLSERIHGLMHAFFHEFPDEWFDTANYHTYWVDQVWSDFLLIFEDGSSGQRYWQVPYRIESDLINFSRREAWTEVELTFLPKAPVAMEVPPDQAAAAVPDEAGPDEVPPTSVNAHAQALRARALINRSQFERW